MDVFSLAVPAGRSDRPPDAVACAGLRAALLGPACRRLPLRETPFDAVSRQLGAGPRELLGHLRRLRREGTLHRIGPTWAPVLQRARWWCTVDAAVPLDAAWRERLAQLPGLASIERPLAGPLPDVAATAAGWGFVLVGRNDAALQAQLAPWQARHGVTLRRLRLQLTGASDTPPPADSPESDLPLAAWLEGGVPLELHPFEAQAHVLGRSTRQLLQRLRTWQRQGWMLQFGVQGAAPRLGPPLEWRALFNPPDMTVDGLARLAAEPGLGALIRLQPGPDQPATWLLTSAGTVALTRPSWLHTLAARGLRPSACWAVQAEPADAPPRLFADAVAGAGQQSMQS